MEKPVSVTLEISRETREKMLLFYEAKPLEGDSPIDFSASAEEVRVTVYKPNRKDKIHALFQGKNAVDEARVWGYEPPAEEIPLGLKKPFPPRVVPEIGSDEVGTGDFFGPVIVAAAYVSKAERGRLKELGVTDSKALDDAKILEIGPKILAFVDYSELCLPNEKYNEVFRAGLNMNAIKAKMHNRALLNVKARHPSALVYVDQFAEPKTYYSYLKQEEEVLRDITFATKGETKFLSVATASVLARYSFLKKMEALGKEYGVTFPLGAGPAVDEFAREFIKKRGLEELSKVAKTNFKNMSRL